MFGWPSLRERVLVGVQGHSTSLFLYFGNYVAVWVTKFEGGSFGWSTIALYSLFLLAIVWMFG